MTSGTTHLHINLSHIPYLCRNSKFTSNNNNNNVDIQSVPYSTRNLLINCKHKSLSQMKSRYDSEFESVSIRSNTETAAPRNRSMSHLILTRNMPTCSARSTHPYLSDGWPIRRMPSKLPVDVNNQILPNSPQSFGNSHQLLDEELPELSIADRKKLLMASIPPFRRSITPNEPIFDNKRCDSSPTQSVAQTDDDTITVDNTQIEKDDDLTCILLPTIPINNEQEPERVKRDTGDDQKQSTREEKVNNVLLRPKLSLNRRCSEATLPLAFSLKKIIKRNKSIKKARCKTYDLVPELDKISTADAIRDQDMLNSKVEVESESISPTRKLFMNSKCKMPRHSLYFQPLSLDYSNRQTDSGIHLACKDKNTNLVESSQRYSSDNSSDRNLSLEFMPLLPYHEDIGSILSDSTLTEDSSYGGDLKLVNSGETLSPNRDSNFDTNHSENYTNTLDSQDGLNLSNSIEGIICGGGDLADSGCHFDQLVNKYFSTQSVKKVTLDLSQMKYVGLSLVGGADSPFGNLPVLVKEIMSGGAAERCDITRGDEIIGINSFSLEDKPLQFAVERLRHCSSRDREITLWVITQADSS